MMGNHVAGDMRANCFSFSGCHYDPASGEATLVYDVDGRELKEKITFPWSPWPMDASRQMAFYQSLELLHLVAGISYYKAGLAHRIDTGKSRVDGELSSFLEDLYTQGLGEFAYINQLDLSGLVKFKTNTAETAVEPPRVADLDLPERALVAMGGGKDSLVSLEMLRAAGVEVQPACVGSSNLIGETVKAAGLPLLRIKRELSAGLAEMNANGAWNGHVPVTAINSVILLCAGLLYGYRYIVFSNESSADEATLKDEQGREINHQYSKGLVFEKALRALIRQRISAGVEYFSLLRPFGEFAITRRFAQMTRYHGVFSSCNRNFHQDGPHIDGRWCLDCPKCRFTALALAPFLSPQQLITIQGADLLDEKKQLEGFKALCGLGVHKPFECVGRISESRSAMKYLANDPQWRNRRVVRELAEHPQIMQAGELDLQADHAAEHCIPAAVTARSDAF